MNKSRLSNIILIAIIALLSFYVTFSANNQRREIKKLTNELKGTTDSLKTIHGAYLKLESNYLEIYRKLDSTRNEFNAFHGKLDSIMHTQITSLSSLNSKLKGIINNEKPVPPIPDENKPFKFDL